ncbi:MAG: threonine aldolase [Flammeovirgaceae bacterium]|jgi:threonine aldolase
MTKPTPEMLEAMMQAPVGDDVFGEDPTVNQLEELGAELFGMEAAIFCPSGTMTNQIGIRLHTQPQDEVICDRLSHVYNYEGGGIAYNSFCSVRLLEGEQGKPTAEMIRENINPDDIHYARTSLVCLENTVNKGGGSCYTLPEIAPITQLCKENKLKLHLDGARLANAIVATGDSTKDYGKYFDTISLCLSKGLGAPVGSLLLGNKADIKHARRIRKVFGGGMRQAGYLAAAGIYALQNNMERMEIDHQHAKEMGSVLETLPNVERVLPIETNIVIFKLADSTPTEVFLEKLKAKNILAAPFGKQQIRFVTHLGVTSEMVDEILESLPELG